MDPTASSEYAIRRLMLWVKGLTLNGAPTVSHVDEGPRSAEGGPWVRVSFDELPSIPAGRFSATQSAVALGLLMTCDVMWPHPDTSGDGAIRPHRIVADELRAAMQFLALDFVEYSTPASPTTVADCTLNIQRVETRLAPDDKGIRRKLVRGYVRWFGRFDDHFA